MHIRKILFCVLFVGSVAYAGDTLSVTFSRLDSLVKAINMLYHLNPDTSGLSSYANPIMVWNGTKWVAMSGLTVSVGSGTFSGTDTRKAVYISGALLTDYCVVTPSNANGTSLPTAGDILMVYMKTDSLIVTRPVSGTSGLTFHYLRVR